MEAEEDKTVCLGDSETTDGPEHGQLAASDDAVAFMSSFGEFSFYFICNNEPTTLSMHDKCCMYMCL